MKTTPAFPPAPVLHARPEAVRRVAGWTASPDLPEPRPALEQVRVEADGRCVSTNGHVLALYDPTTPPAEETYPDYQRVIPTVPPLLKLRVSLYYLRKIVKELDRLRTSEVELAVWADNKPLKLSATDEDGTLTLYVMPLGAPNHLPTPPDPPDTPIEEWIVGVDALVHQGPHPRTDEVYDDDEMPF